MLNGVEAVPQSMGEQRSISSASPCRSPDPVVLKIVHELKNHFFILSEKGSKASKAATTSLAGTKASERSCLIHNATSGSDMYLSRRSSIDWIFRHRH